MFGLGKAILHPCAQCAINAQALLPICIAANKHYFAESSWLRITEGNFLYPKNHVIKRSKGYGPSGGTSMQVFLCIRSQSARSLKSCANMEMQRAGRDFRRHPGGTRGKNGKGIDSAGIRRRIWKHSSGGTFGTARLRRRDGPVPRRRRRSRRKP